MIVLSFNIEKMTTEQIQALGEKWLMRLGGHPKRLGKKYLYRPASNRSRGVYGTCEEGRSGVIGIFLEIIANVLLQEQEAAILFEGRRARKEKRERKMILGLEKHIIPVDGHDTYKPYKIA